MEKYRRENKLLFIVGLSVVVYKAGRYVIIGKGGKKWWKVMKNGHVTEILSSMIGGGGENSTDLSSWEGDLGWELRR